MDDLHTFLTWLFRQSTELHYPWVHNDAIAKWPKGRFEKLLKTKILVPSERIAPFIECPACHDETAEPTIIKYPDGDIAAQWWCNYDPDYPERVDIEMEQLRLWDIVVETFPTA